MRIKRIERAGTVLVILLALAGCGGVKEAQVSGTVKLDGKPIETGSISFFPVDGKAPTAGGPIKNGEYNVKVPVGETKVVIKAPRVIGKKKIYPTPDSLEMPIHEEAVPARYNEQTELKLDVHPGTNQKDYDLPGK